MGRHSCKFQGSFIETDELFGFDEEQEKLELPDPLNEETVCTVLNMIRDAKRPVIYAGYGIRLAGAVTEFKEMIDKLEYRLLLTGIL